MLLLMKSDPARNVKELSASQPLLQFGVCGGEVGNSVHTSNVHTHTCNYFFIFTSLMYFHAKNLIICNNYSFIIIS